jgi:maltooligosyltrehalose trehalohydrolase
MNRNHLMPFGAETCEDGSVRFRLWAPQAEGASLEIEVESPLSVPLARLEDGWFELITRDAHAGSLYRFQIDNDLRVPDPASRFQPQDIAGPSQVVDPRAFSWEDEHWRGRPWEEAVIYELHVGAFTPEGSFRAVEDKLDYLRDLGVTALELMPLSDFPGRRNWGYDGVLPFAPDSSYGSPEDLKRLIQAAHARGLMMILDVVYNHFGPEGNYLGSYAPQFFTDRHRTPWGDAINFDGPGSRFVREFFVHNALYWLEEYHFDGLRLDAVHSIIDNCDPDILTELAETVRQRLAHKRFVHLILENGDNESRYLTRNSENRPTLYNAQWNDDIHHALHVLTTGETDGYYSDYAAMPLNQLGRCLTEGFAFQGEYSEYHKENRGEPSRDLPPSAFVSFLQNHDQIGNRACGERILALASPEAVRAAMAILLLAPSPPLLFMGQEFGAASPFLFFCDFQGDLAKAVTQGRRNEFAGFAEFSSAELRDWIPDPNAESTFVQSKLDWNSIDDPGHAEWLSFYRELLTLRARVIVPYSRTMVGAQARFCDCQKSVLSAEWKLDRGAVLMLRANLSSEWIVTEKLPQPEDRLYASSPQAAEGLKRNQLSPWSAVWFLQL